MLKKTPPTTTNEREATMTTYLTYKRAAWYLEGFHMIITAFDADGAQVGDICALYQYKTNRLSDLTVTLLATGDTGEVKVSHGEGRKAVQVAKTMLENMLKKSASVA